MTYLAAAKKGKLSVYILNLQTNQAISSTTYVDVNLTSGYQTVVNQFSSSLSVNFNTDMVTLPSGKYFLDARMSSKRSSIGSWGVEYQWFEYDGSNKNAIGYEGREVGSLAIGDPAKNEHARAYIESDGTQQIGMFVKKIAGSSPEIEDTQYANYGGRGRCMIWRIE
tara:strand:+ start:1231 stop:1731 length:501 start_codon:yes stop_codon:yes gene_type:complete